MLIIGSWGSVDSFEFSVNLLPRSISLFVYRTYLSVYTKEIERFVEVTTAVYNTIFAVYKGLSLLDLSKCLHKKSVYLIPFVYKLRKVSRDFELPT